jgi:DNA-binding SARP family transcriptional activator
VIYARVLGPADVSLDGNAVPPELLWRKNLALLVYLARSPRRARGRDHLLGLLWPDKPEALARRSLNGALWIIRKCVGEGGLEAAADQVRLSPNAIQLDTERFETLEQAGDWRGAAALVAGEYLEGFGVPGASEFEDWLTTERRLWGRRAVDVLLHTAEQAMDGGDTGAAIAAARRGLTIDPLSDSAAGVLMRAIALDGDRAAALQEYEDFAARLMRQVGAEPQTNTVALADRIRRERASRATRQAMSTRDHRRTPLVGRSEQLERLWRAWQGARTAGHPTLGVITGHPGVGKTRLAEELSARMRLAGATTALVRAVEADLTTPWSGLLGLGRGGLLNAAGLGAAPASALAWFAAAIPEWADRFPGSRSALPVAPGLAFGEMLRAALAEQPITLFLDDAAWLDRESILAVEAAFRDLAHLPFAVVLTVPESPARPELDQLQARIGRDLTGVVIHLDALSGEEIRGLAHWAMPSYDDAALDRLVRRVVTDSAGLPLLVVELLTAVAGGLDLDRSTGAWPEPMRTLDQTLPGDLPDAVVGAIRVGYWRLSPDARHILQAAAVLEPRTGADRLVRATGLEATTVNEGLDELEWARWLTADGCGYTFVARIIREVVAADLVTDGQRRRLLERAGPLTVSP